jgi:hypothetical protein
MLIGCAMGEVQAKDIHARLNQGLNLLGATACGPEGGNNFGCSSRSKVTAHPIDPLKEITTLGSR